MINNLDLRFEALWPKILSPDLKTCVYFIFAHPLGATMVARPINTATSLSLEGLLY